MRPAKAGVSWKTRCSGLESISQQPVISLQQQLIRATARGAGVSVGSPPVSTSLLQQASLHLESACERIRRRRSATAFGIRPRCPPLQRDFEVTVPGTSDDTRGRENVSDHTLS